VIDSNLPPILHRF